MKKLEHDGAIVGTVFYQDTKPNSPDRMGSQQAEAFRYVPSDITDVTSAVAADFQRFVSIFLSPLFGTVRSATSFVD